VFSDRWSAVGLARSGSLRDDGSRDAASRFARLRDAGTAYGGDPVSRALAERDDGELRSRMYGL